jgi:hypothetical protein
VSSPNQQRINRILHREKVDDKTLVFAVGAIDELISDALKAIPFDSPQCWGDWIREGIKNGFLSSVVLYLDEKPIGSITYAISGEPPRKELLISHAYINDTTFGYLPLLSTFASRVAKEAGCNSIRFHTVRKGLIIGALRQGFHVSEIVLRKPL